MRDRIRAIILAWKGMTAKKIASKLDFTGRWVQKWVARYRKSGFDDGLQDEPRSRAPKLLPADQEEALINRIFEGPKTEDKMYLLKNSGETEKPWRMHSSHAVGRGAPSEKMFLIIPTIFILPRIIEKLRIFYLNPAKVAICRQIAMAGVGKPRILSVGHLASPEDAWSATPLPQMVESAFMRIIVNYRR